MHYRKCGPSFEAPLCVLCTYPVINLQLFVIYGAVCSILLAVVINCQFIRLLSSSWMSDLNDKSYTVTNAYGNAWYSWRVTANVSMFRFTVFLRKWLLLPYCMNKIIARQVTHVIISKAEIRFYYWSLNLQLRWEESLIKCYIMRLIH